MVPEHKLAPIPVPYTSTSSSYQILVYTLAKSTSTTIIYLTCMYGVRQTLKFSFQVLNYCYTESSGIWRCHACIVMYIILSSYSSQANCETRL